MPDSIPDAGPLVRLDRVGDVVSITLNRPERMNAVNLVMRDALWDGLCLLRDDPTVRAAIILGAGERAFSAGADITEFGSAPSLLAARESRQQRDVWGVMASLRIPLIAAIHGYAYGAGLEMSMYCDLRIAAEDALFALPEVSLGYIPSAGGTQNAARHLSRSDALELVTTGAPIDAAQAFDRGLVHAVVPRANLEATARRWADALAELSPAAVRATKRAVIEGLDLSLADGLALERRLAAAVALGGAA